MLFSGMRRLGSREGEYLHWEHLDHEALPGSPPRPPLACASSCQTSYHLVLCLR